MTQSNIDKLKQAKRAIWIAREAINEVCLRTPFGEDDAMLVYLSRARATIDAAHGNIVAALDHCEVTDND